jgi:prepilin peptidase CpaA
MNATIPELLCLLGLAGLLIWAAVGDFRRYLIPNWLSLAVLGLFPVYLVFSARPVDWAGGLIASVVLLVIGIGLFALKLAGGGDVKLLAATALWAGTKLVLPLLLVMALAGGVLALAFLVARYSKVRMQQDEAESDGGPATAGSVLTGVRLPYGVAIATGGLYVVAHLASG